MKRFIENQRLPIGPAIYRARPGPAQWKKIEENSLFQNNNKLHPWQVCFCVCACVV